MNRRTKHAISEYTNKPKLKNTPRKDRFNLLFGVILFWVLVIMVLVVGTQEAKADTLTIEPEVIDMSDTGITTQEVYSSEDGYVGESATYDFGDGNFITEITTNEE